MQSVTREFTERSSIKLVLLFLYMLLFICYAVYCSTVLNLSASVFFILFIGNSGKVDKETMDIFNQRKTTIPSEPHPCPIPHNPGTAEVEVGKAHGLKEYLTSQHSEQKDKYISTNLTNSALDLHLSVKN